MAMQWAGESLKKLPLNAAHMRSTEEHVGQAATQPDWGTQERCAPSHKPGWGQAAGRGWAPHSLPCSPEQQHTALPSAHRLHLPSARPKTFLADLVSDLLKNLPELFLTDLPHHEAKREGILCSLRMFTRFWYLLFWSVDTFWSPQTDVNPNLTKCIDISTFTHLAHRPVRSSAYLFLLERNVF